MPYKFKVYLDTKKAHEYFDSGLIGLLETEDEPKLEDLVSDYIEYVKSLDSEDMENVILQGIVNEGILNGDEFSVKLDLKNSSV